jgi:hypothetical protein
MSWAAHHKLSYLVLAMIDQSLGKKVIDIKEANKFLNQRELVSRIVLLKGDIYKCELQ